MKIDYQPVRADYDAAWARQQLCFTQHWAWGEAKRPASQPARIMIDEMAATILVRKLPGLGGKFGYMPRAFNQSFLNSTDLKALSEELCEKLRLSHLLIEPYVYGPTDLDVTTWQQQGFAINTHTVNARHTNLLDVRQSDEDIVAHMEHDARRRLKQAVEREDLSFREDTSLEGLHRFYQCLHGVSKRSRFVVQDEAYFAKIFEVFQDTGLVHLLFVERGTELLYASFAIADNGILRRLYGGPTETGRKEPAGHLLLWESIKLARQLDLTHIDFWGVAPYDEHGFDQRHSLYGVSKFKAGFGGQNVTYLPELIWVRDRGRYQAYRAMLRAHRGLLRLRKALG